MSEMSQKVYYIGSDDSYWDTVKSRYKSSYEQVDWFFEKIPAKEKNDHLQIYLRIFRERPKIVYIDFSSNVDEGKYLVKLMSREYSLRNIPIVVLVENKKNFSLAVSVGATFVHYKCGEHFDVVYDPMVFALDNYVVKPDFAKAVFQRDSRLIADFRLGYIAPDHIHVEGNLKINKGDVVEIESEIPKSIVKSKNYVVSDIINHNLYYDFDYGINLSYVFVDEPVPGKPDDFEDMVAYNKSEMQKMTQYQEDLNYAKKKMKEWVLDSMDSGQHKTTKILIVDHELRILEKATEPLDSFPYSLRIQSDIYENMDEVNRLRPGIIAYQFEDDLTEAEEETTEKKSEKKDDKKTMLSKLTELINYIKKIPDYRPFIVLFNCIKYDAKSFQESFKYSFILTHGQSMKFDMVIKFAKLFDEKQKTKRETEIKAKIQELRKQDPKKYAKITAQSFEDKHYYIKKTNPLSHVSYQYPIVLSSMTESECTFLVEKEIELKNYRLNFPIPMYIRVIPIDDRTVFVKEDGKLKYKCLIHGVDETDKKKLRQFVNEIFFSTLNEQRKQEQEEFKRLQAEALNEKLKGDEEIDENDESEKES